MLAQALVEVVKRHPDHEAIIYGASRMSYRELYGKIQALSRAFNSVLDMNSGDCIALVLPNCPEFVISFYAAAWLNAVILPLNHLFKAEEISYYISDSNAKVIVTDLKHADSCRDIIQKLSKDIKLVVVNGVYPSAASFDDLISEQELEPYEDLPCFSGEMIYQYSSGSTGRPKRVCRTQENLYHEAKSFAETAHITPHDQILCIVPLFHAHGLGNCLLAATCNGAKLVILEQFLQDGVPVEVPFVFRRLRVLELLETEKITVLPAVPYIFNTLAETPLGTSVDLSTLRFCFSAGNFLSKDIFEQFRQRFTIPIRQLYGCTEAGAISINLDPDVEKTYDSVGLPLKNVEIKIIDDEGCELPPGEIGEVLVKSKSLTRGYDNLPELNQQAFKHGCFWTGDLGKKDEAGRLYITGRKKILIDTGGYKVDPLEIEDVLVAHSNVREAVVVGVKGAYEGEKIKAVIVPERSHLFDEREILSFCRERLAEFKVPRIVEFRDEIPKSPLGKILRKDLV